MQGGPAAARGRLLFSGPARYDWPGMKATEAAVSAATIMLLGAGCAAALPAPAGVGTGSGRPQAAAAAEAAASTTANVAAPEAASGTVREVGFDAPFALVPGETVSVGDELDVTLESIADSRCKPGTVCVRAGELGAKLEVTVRNGGESEELELGQLSAPKGTVYLREFTLVSADDGSVELSVGSVPVVETQDTGEE